MSFAVTAFVTSIGAAIWESYWIAAAIISSVLAQQTAASKARERQRKAQQDAEARADAAKGFQLSVTGEVTSLGIPYGRNLIAGARVYHVAPNSYTYAAIGTGNVVAKGYGAYTNLTENISGSKHEFLFIQQAINVGGINDIVQVLVDSRKYDDTAFSEGNCGHRFHIYLDGNQADPLMLANDGPDNERANALFTNIAYATMVFKLNRDDPQYHGIPQVQFMIEGMKIYTIDNNSEVYTLSGTKTYTNNPAYCLLDYLLNPIYGKGLSTDKIDLKSFWLAARECDKVMHASKPLDGDYWSAKGGTRSIKRFECNVTLDSGKALRDNIELLLETMALAELLWSEGKYKLSLLYPTIFDPALTYTKHDVVQHTSGGIPSLYRALSTVDGSLYPPPNATYWSTDPIRMIISDDDLLRENDNTTSWPNSQSKLNYATVRFLNETKGFTEDTVGWPPKINTYDGAQDQGAWNSATTYFTNQSVTYSGDRYKLRPYTGGYQSATPPSADTQWTLAFTNTVYTDMLAEDSGIELEGDFFEAGVTDYYSAVAKAEQRVRFSRIGSTYNFRLKRKALQLEPGDIIRVNSEILSITHRLLRIDEVKTEQDNSVLITASLYDAALLAWNAKDDQYVKPLIYQARQLEQATNLNISYSSDLALSAGTLTWTLANDIRVSRYAILYTTDVVIDSNTNWVEIGVSNINKFDLPPLFKDDYTFAVVAMSGSGRRAAQSGWPTVGMASANINTNWYAQNVQVSIYVRSSTEPSTPTGGVYDFTQMALTTVPAGWYALPPNGTDTLWVSYALAIRETADNLDNTLSWVAPIFYSSSSAQLAYNAYLTREIVGVLQDTTGTNFGYADANGYLYLDDANGHLNNVSPPYPTFSVVSTENCSVSINNNYPDPERGYFNVTSLTGDLGKAVLRATYNAINFDRILQIQAISSGYQRDVTPPPAPIASSIDVTTALSNVFLKINVMPNYTEGHGHKETVVYTHSDQNSGASATLLARFRGNFTVIPVSGTLGSPRYLWFKNFSIDGVESTNAWPLLSAPGIDATTGKINGSDLSNYLIEAQHLAQQPIIDSIHINGGAVTAGKLAANSVVAGNLAANAIIANDGVIGSLSADVITTGTLNTGVIAANSIHGDKITADSVTASKIDSRNLSIKDGAGNVILSAGVPLNTANISGLGALGLKNTIDNATYIETGIINSGHIGNAQIGTAQIANEIASTNYVADTSGWKIWKSGSAEFNGPVISRELIVDEGYINSSSYAPNNLTFDYTATYPQDGFDIKDLSTGHDPSGFVPEPIYATSVETITAWSGAKHTYICEAGFVQGQTVVYTYSAYYVPNVLWGLVAEVWPLTIWSGPQVLRIGFKLITRNVLRIYPWQIHWRLYKVT